MRNFHQSKTEETKKKRKSSETSDEISESSETSGGILEIIEYKPETVPVIL